MKFLTGQHGLKDQIENNCCILSLTHRELDRCGKDLLWFDGWLAGIEKQYLWSEREQLRRKLKQKLILKKFCEIKEISCSWVPPAATPTGLDTGDDDTIGNIVYYH